MNLIVYQFIKEENHLYKLKLTTISNRNLLFAMKSNNLLSKIKKFLKLIYQKVILKEIYLEGKEPPKSYAFSKKFIGIYALFLSISLILLIIMNISAITFSSFFEQLFIIGNAIVALFILLSLLYSSDKLRDLIFEKHTGIKQLIIFLGAGIGFYLLFRMLFLLKLNLLTYLYFLSTVWLILLSTRFYMYSRKFATKLEAKFITKYSPTRRFLAGISPYFILGLLIVLALFYRLLLVFISLDFFGPYDPQGAVAVYQIEMRLVMPLIYFSLIMTLIFIIFEFVFTRRKAETKRAGLFDNYTFSLIVFFIFFFQIFQTTIFLLLRPETISALKATVGATSSTVSFIFIFEFLISMIFLYRVIKKLGRSLGWQIFLFKRDGLILLILGCVIAQTLTRFGLEAQISNQEVSIIGNFLMYDKYIISIIMIFFLGATLLVYYLKPQSTSMFIRLQKETVDIEQEKMEIVYKLLKSEYIRRGEAYPIEILDRELIKATKLPKNAVYSLINELADSNMDVLIRDIKGDYGITQKFIDFVSITEKFDKKEVAQKKAKSYLSQRLYDTMTKKSPDLFKLNSDLESGKASDRFMSSLTNTYSKKLKDERLREKKQQEAVISFTEKDIPESLKDLIIEILKKEYIYRIENYEEYPDFQFPISEIASIVQMETKITPGELYPILENLNTEDIELRLLKNSNEPEDKIIRFFPIADDALIYSLANFRPNEFNKVKIEIINKFVKFLKRKKSKAAISKLKKGIGKNTEEQRLWENILKNLFNYYPLYTEVQDKIQAGEGILKVFKIFPKKEIDIFL
ncbi:MAG: hypothetical protein WBH31_11895 [Promethearchaeia archaeon]